MTRGLSPLLSFAPIFLSLHLHSTAVVINATAKPCHHLANKMIITLALLSLASPSSLLHWEASFANLLPHASRTHALTSIHDLVLPLGFGTRMA
jgi:hypothetical protein